MKTLRFTAMLFALAVSSQAQPWLLSEYRKVTTDSLRTANFYGARPSLNQASKGVVIVPEPGYIRFEASTIASDPDTAPKGSGYSANVGLMQPLSFDWAEHDISGLTGLNFEFRNSEAITGELAFSFGSASYDATNADSGQIYSVAIADNLAAGTEWKKVVITKADFATPLWWEKPSTFPKFDSVLKRVKNIQIAPRSTYTAGSKGSQIKAGGVEVPCEDCTGPTMTKQTLDVRNIVLEGVGHAPPSNDRGCQDKYLLLDNFADGNLKVTNMAAMYWYSYTDSGNADVTKAKGSSTASMAIMSASDLGSTSGLLTLDAKLNKTSLDGKWQPYAGWAAVGFHWRSEDAADLSGVTGFQFKLGEKGNTNADLVEAIAFKLGIAGIDEAESFQVRLPLKALGSGATVCVRPDDLKQPSYVVNAKPLNLKNVTKLSWELKIANNKDPSIDTASASMWLTDVKLFGIDVICLEDNVDAWHCSVGVDSRPSVKFSSSYKNGMLSLSGYKDVDVFEVVALDGSKIASFAPVASMRLDLARGTYFLVAKRGSIGTARQFVVADR